MAVVFLVIFAVSLLLALLLLNRLRIKDANEKLQRLAQLDSLTVSIGGEAYADKEESLSYPMILNADKKLYLAKENGRNQFVV